MNDFADIQVIKASAGSGKTYTLVSSYICMLFQSPGNKKFTGILAVTFTNKAAEEMKLRILEALDDIMDKGTESIYLNKCNLQLDDRQVKAKAERIRKNILHDFNYFTVSTIDSFVQRVVRSFAFEFRLPANFQIQLDQSKVKAILYDMLMDKLIADEDLQAWMMQFVLYRIEEGKGWNISQALMDMMNYVFQEDFWQIYHEHREKFSRDNLKKIAQEIERVQSEYRQKINAVKQKIDEFINPWKSRYNTVSLPKNLGNLLKFLFNSFDERADLTDFFSKKYARLILEGGEKFWPKNMSLYNNEVVNFFVDNLHILSQLIAQVYDIYQRDYALYLTARAIKENFYFIGLFIDIVGLLDEYRKRYNEFMILDLSIFLRQIIGESQAPFVYEKIGQRIENILIDEFQDTSHFQWDNFVPLIDNSYSQGYGSLLVGDVKQSIYRWRGGDWRLLLTGVKQRFPNAREYALDTNYRSFQNIVFFNNKLFPQIVEVLKIQYKDLNEKVIKTIEQAYADAEQKVADINQSFNGLVEVTFTNAQRESITQEAILDHIVDKLGNLLSQGYKYSDIAILVRKNDYIKLIVSKLIEAYEQGLLPELSILSNESLFVKLSPAIILIVNALRYIDAKDDISLYSQKITGEQDDSDKANAKNLSVKAFYYLTVVVKNYYKAQGRKLNIAQLLIDSDEEKLLELLPQEFANAGEKLKKFTLYDRVMYLIRLFDLNNKPEHLPYLRTFEDFVLDFMYEEGSDIKLFLQMWDDKSKGLTVDLAHNEESLTIMTIHGAKGLAFPVVIVPFADWDLQPGNDTFVWATLFGEFYSQLPVYPIKYKKRYFSSLFGQDLLDELLFTVMDALNLLYVAFTRPKEQLIVYAKTKYAGDSKSKENKKVGDLLFRSLSNLSAANPAEFKLHESSVELEDGTELPWITVTVDKNAERKKITKRNQQSQQKHKLLSFPISDWRDKLDIKFAWKEMYKDTKEELRQAIDRGELMHKIMSEVRTIDQVSQVVDRFYSAGQLGDYEPEQITAELTEMIKKAGVVDWFSDNWNVETEMSIILPGSGFERRPDRVISNDSQVIVIDFKFASPEAKHRQQVKEYVQLLSQIYPDRQVQGYLLYGDGNLIKV